MELSKEQDIVLKYILDQMRKYRYDLPEGLRGGTFQTIVSGYAGTGKTTLLSYLRKEINKLFPRLSVAFITYTGKASSVLKLKLETNNVNTIHGLIYKPEVRWDKRLQCHVIVDWKLKKSDEIYNDIIIIDEGSMVSKKIWLDLQKFSKSIIVMGDHGQLPPIGDSFSLMKTPDFKLTEIHRQALDSPIIALSKFVRENGYIPFNRVFSKEVFKLSWNHKSCKKLWDEKVVFDENLIVLCAFNSTRTELNQKIRKKLGFSEKIPGPGERVVCLQNDHVRGIMNGQISTLMWLMPEDYGLYRMTLDIDGYPDPTECIASNKCFGEVVYTLHDKDMEKSPQYKYAKRKGILPIDYFDYGYAMSVHKSQGSEWNKVILFEQRTKKWDDEYYTRWLYTAITRSREKLFVISDFWG